MLLKVHSSYRLVVALCDSELIGKKFEEGKKRLEITERFYKGDKYSEEKILNLLYQYSREDATFNIVGEKSVKAAIKSGIISEESVGRIKGIPHALTLL